MRDRVKASNQIHGFLLEFGVSLPIGHAVIRHLPSVLAATALPVRLISIIERLHAHYKYLDEQFTCREGCDCGVLKKNTAAAG